MDDLTIIEQVLRGNNNAFGQLVERYQTKVYNLALRMCGNEDDAYDLSQEAFVKAWQNLDSFHREAAFSTWLFRLTSNVCIDFLRSQKRRNAVSLSCLDDDNAVIQLDLPDPGLGPEAAVLAAEDRELLARALDQLPTDCRQIITLRAIDDLSYAQIAQVLNIQEGTVKSRLSRARAQLKNKLLQIGNKSPLEASILTGRGDAR